MKLNTPLATCPHIFTVPMKVRDLVTRGLSVNSADKTNPSKDRQERPATEMAPTVVPLNVSLLIAPLVVRTAVALILTLSWIPLRCRSVVKPPLSSEVPASPLLLYERSRFVGPKGCGKLELRKTEKAVAWLMYENSPCAFAMPLICTPPLKAKESIVVLELPTVRAAFKENLSKVTDERLARLN